MEHPAVKFGFVLSVATNPHFLRYIGAALGYHGGSTVIEKAYFVRQAGLLFELAKATKDPKISAALLEKAADLKLQVDEPGAPNLTPLALDFEPPAMSGSSLDCPVIESHRAFYPAAGLECRDHGEALSKANTLARRIVSSHFCELVGETGVALGKVKFFNQEKGYGFIRPDDGGSDVFVHITAVEKAGYTSLADGARISYELLPDGKGKQTAQNLRLAE